MAEASPLNETEEAFFRALMRLSITLPRALGDDLVREQNVTASEYTTLMNLSEAPGRELRISDLASLTALSISRMSRLLDQMQQRGLVIKRRSEIDGRGNLACLTRDGLALLRSAYPFHLASVRRLVMDPLSESDKKVLARILGSLADTIDEAAQS